MKIMERENIKKRKDNVGMDQVQKKQWGESETME